MLYDCARNHCGGIARPRARGWENVQLCHIWHGWGASRARARVGAGSEKLAKSFRSFRAPARAWGRGFGSIRFHKNQRYCGRRD